MNFAAKALPMTRTGLADALSKLQLGPGQTACLWAVFEVETAGLTQGFGFRSDRRPQILFERHKFHEFTKGKFDDVASDLSSRTAGGYGTIAQQYVKLERALSLCAEQGLGEELALDSASWGLGQVMGFNSRAAGFPNTRTMVEAMVLGEDAQLLAMVNFLIENDLDEAMRNQDWERFAKRYNGTGYWKNQYDVKLEAQYARFSSGSIPDIEVRTAQAGLLLLGYPPGKIDGVLGSRTRGALRGFQTAGDLAPSGELTEATYMAIWNAAFS